jgi:hypothetical protein
VRASGALQDGFAVANALVAVSRRQRTSQRKLSLWN